MDKDTSTIREQAIEHSIYVMKNLDNYEPSSISWYQGHVLTLLCYIVTMLSTKEKKEN